MSILDIHTHQLPDIPGRAILNVSPGNFAPEPGEYYSVGYHPWYLSAEGTEDWELLSKQITHPQVLAIGEAGLDKVTEVDYRLQEMVFERQIVLSTSVRKPLIIHCVRSYNEVMAFKKTFNPADPWIIHGFRGKKELAKQLTDHGIYLSYGFNYQEDALRATPPDMLFFETDENCSDIYLLYQQAANHLSLSVNELTKRTQENIDYVFLSNKSCLFE